MITLDKPQDATTQTQTGGDVQAKGDVADTSVTPAETPPATPVQSPSPEPVAPVTAPTTEKTPATETPASTTEEQKTPVPSLSPEPVAPTEGGSGDEGTQGPAGTL